ncbi:uncharacterized protein PADG_07228 [Paracoccidioides brasiliensis Pb18]|uniref:Uncharacterized protein n=2 Tax=Paracoccidioides brasiliensis TaxID=121759 RepID=C1GIZ2_PARBD|nr:uncharacterized protein PADG_07228 [Paracoccidioides brasiliensis Pb18]EEH42408.2 hypothetical protein PADG_07228 [Paracoccidioides brasiliensis Pb18]ODH25917.1 hypothetical protein ACO22_04950 [Paracoccidioides brasiliensis]ODH48069.1 hypothetical protein GX48_05834 [Paracoccidioides brasiliensis]
MWAGSLSSAVTTSNGEISTSETTGVLRDDEQQMLTHIGSATSNSVLCRVVIRLGQNKVRLRKAVTASHCFMEVQSTHCTDSPIDFHVSKARGGSADGNGIVPNILCGYGKSTSVIPLLHFAAAG